MNDFSVICPSCGETEFCVSSEVDRFEYGHGEDAVELSVTIPVHMCESCGYQFTDGDAEDIRHEAVCRHLGRMPPAKILELRKANCLTRADLAALTGIGSASLARWETGQLIQGAAHDSLLYLLLNKDNLELLAARKPEPDYTVGVHKSLTTEDESTFIHIKTPTDDMIWRKEHFSLHVN